MRKLAILAPIFAVLFFSLFASAQQGDAMFGGGTLLSSGSCNVNTGCPEKGGFYPSVSADVIFKKRIGFNFETAWKGSQGEYVADHAADPFSTVDAMIADAGWARQETGLHLWVPP